MNAIWPPFAGWLLHSAVGGGILLLLALPMPSQILSIGNISPTIWKHCEGSKTASG